MAKHKWGLMPNRTAIRTAVPKQRGGEDEFINPLRYIITENSGYPAHEFNLISDPIQKRSIFFVNGRACEKRPNNKF